MNKKLHCICALFPNTLVDVDNVVRYSFKKEKNRDNLYCQEKCGQCRNGKVVLEAFPDPCREEKAFSADFGYLDLNLADKRSRKIGSR